MFASQEQHYGTLHKSLPQDSIFLCWAKLRSRQQKRKICLGEVFIELFSYIYNLFAMRQGRQSSFYKMLQRFEHCFSSAETLLGIVPKIWLFCAGSLQRNFQMNWSKDVKRKCQMGKGFLSLENTKYDLIFADRTMYLLLLLTPCHWKT